LPQVLDRGADAEHDGGKQNGDEDRWAGCLLRLQFLLRGVLLTGWFMIILGAIAVSMTVRFTRDQLAGRLSTNPKVFLTIMPWITAPPTLRILGTALLILGIGFVSIAFIWKSSGNSRAVA
jgi:hypothetical protein